MKTKSGKSHWTCKTNCWCPEYGDDTNENFKFTAFDGVAYLESLVRYYAKHGMRFTYSDLTNLDE